MRSRFGLIGALGIGAVMGAYGVAGCDSRQPLIVPIVEANEGGTGGSGGAGGSGAGGVGGSGVLDCTGIPDYLCNIDGQTSDEFMDVVYCIVEKHEELVQANSRAGYLMGGLKGCGGCIAERNEIGPEGMVYLAKHGVYHDPNFSTPSANRIIDFGAYYVPLFAESHKDPFPTTETPEGISTDLRRRKEGFNSLQELADLAGCPFAPAADAREMSKEDVIKRYGSLKTKIDYKEVARTLLKE